MVWFSNKSRRRGCRTRWRSRNIWSLLSSRIVSPLLLLTLLVQGDIKQTQHRTRVFDLAFPPTYKEAVLNQTVRTILMLVFSFAVKKLYKNRWKEMVRDVVIGREKRVVVMWHGCTNICNRNKFLKNISGTTFHLGNQAKKYFWTTSVLFCRAPKMLLPTWRKNGSQHSKGGDLSVKPILLL